MADELRAELHMILAAFGPNLHDAPRHARQALALARSYRVRSLYGSYCRVSGLLRPAKKTFSSNMEGARVPIRWKQDAWELADVEVRLGNPERAIDLYHQVLALLRRTAPGGHRDRHFIRTHLCLAELVSAGTMSPEVESTLVDLLLETSWETPTVLWVLGLGLLMQDRVAEAREFYSLHWHGGDDEEKAHLIATLLMPAWGGQDVTEACGLALTKALVLRPVDAIEARALVVCAMSKSGQPQARALHADVAREAAEMGMGPRSPVGFLLAWSETLQSEALQGNQR